MAKKTSKKKSVAEELEKIQKQMEGLSDKKDDDIEINITLEDVKVPEVKPKKSNVEVKVEKEIAKVSVSPSVEKQINEQFCFEEEYFEKIARSGTDLTKIGLWQKMYAAFINNIIHLYRKNVLDLGCAFGAIPACFSERGAFVTGVDISFYAIEKNLFKCVKYVQNSMHDMKDIPSDTFHLVHSMMSINHVAPDLIKSTFEEIKRVSKNGSFVLIIFNKGDNVQKVDDMNYLYTKEFFDEIAKELGMEDIYKTFYRRMISVEVPGWNFMRKYQWPFVAYQVRK
jgi:SAM-dependent methyltransferase